MHGFLELSVERTFDAEYDVAYEDHLVPFAVVCEQLENSVQVVPVTELVLTFFFLLLLGSTLFLGFFFLLFRFLFDLLSRTTLSDTTSTSLRLLGGWASLGSWSGSLCTSLLGNWFFFLLVISQHKSLWPSQCIHYVRLRISHMIL